MIHSSGNVFEDLGLPDAEELLSKHAGDAIIKIIRDDKLTQVQAGARLKIDQANVSRLMRGRLDDFSIERLLHFLTLLGNDVFVKIRPHESGNRIGRLVMA